MTEQELKTLNLIRDQYAKELIDDAWYKLYEHNDQFAMSKIHDEVCRRYAEEVNNEIPLLKHKIDLFEKSEIEWRNIVQKKKDKISELEAEITRLKESLDNIESRTLKRIQELEKDINDDDLDFDDQISSVLLAKENKRFLKLIGEVKP